MKCYHHNDLDGRCAAAIVDKFNKRNNLSQVEYIEVDYKDVIDVESIVRHEVVYIVDFSFKPEVMEEVLKRTTNVVWLDHHKTAMEYKYSIELGGMRSSAWSGCELVWRHLFAERDMPMAVKLIGDYDKWALKLQPACFEFYEGMKLEKNAPTSSIWEKLFDDNSLVEAVCLQGRMAIRYRDNYCADICKTYGYETEIEGHKAFATNLYRFGSKGFGELFDKYDCCLAYIYDGKQFTVSLYSQKIDVSEIAKKYGGGGHKGAAGFVCKKLPFAPLGM